MQLNPAPFHQENDEYIPQQRKTQYKNRTIKKRRNSTNTKVSDFLEAMRMSDTNDNGNGNSNGNGIRSNYNNISSDMEDDDAETNPSKYLQAMNTNKNGSKMTSLPNPELFSKKEQFSGNTHSVSDFEMKYNPDRFETMNGTINNGNGIHGNTQNYIETKRMHKTSTTNDEPISTEQYGNIRVDANKYKEYFNNYVPYIQNASNSQNIDGPKDVLLEKLNYMIHLLEEQQEEKTGHVTEELILYCFLGVFMIFVVDSFVKVGKYVR